MPARATNPLFHDLSSEEMAQALRFFDAQEISYPRGTVIKSAMDRLTRFALVLSGSVQVSMDDINGRQLVLNCVQSGQTFGEALCFLQKEAPLTFLALSDVTLLWLRCDNLYHAQPCSISADLCSKMHRRFTAMLAERTLSMNDRIQILSRSGIREKLRAFFAECARDAGSNRFAVPFDRAGMAAYLNVDRSALSRELSMMQKRGEIRFHKNTFELNIDHFVAIATDNEV
ncbi:MAG: Crp/Fnr family transcriptional regulator [Clostridia bacterium]|nr:Crp/Fnr family transcriptional regulator [Clostridia bacterium]